MGPVKSLLKAITNRSAFLGPREPGWGWVGRIEGVYQGPWLRKCPKLDLPMPIPKWILWEGPEEGGGSLFLGVPSSLFCARPWRHGFYWPTGPPENSSVPFCFCPGTPITRSFTRGPTWEPWSPPPPPPPTSAASSTACEHFNHRNVPSLGREFGETFTNQSIGWLQIIYNGIIWKCIFFPLFLPHYITEVSPRG